MVMVVEDFGMHRAQRGGDAPLPLVTVSVLEFAGKAKPVRLFIDRTRLLPLRNVVLLYGDGGMGKSLLALQLALACSSSLSRWIGIEVDHGPVLYVSAEDDRDEINIRVAEIAEGEDIDLADCGGLEFLFMAGQDTTLGAEQGRTGTIKAMQPLYDRLDATMSAIGPIVMVLDNLADVYAGNENNRSAVKGFIGLLRRLAIKHDCVIVLLAHPSLQGMATGTGMSGSTAWSNSVRSRLYLHKPDPLDDTQRVLEAMKANYGPAGTKVGLKWVLGRFVAVDLPKPFDKVRMEHPDIVAAEFNRGSWRFDEQSSEWGGFFVAQLLDLDVGAGVPAGERLDEQKRNRATVRTILGTWLKNKVISKVEKMDGDQRKTRSFFGGAPGVA